MDRIYVMQLVRSFQVGAISRRTFLQRASVAVGGMAAANMLLAACRPVQGTPRLRCMDCSPAYPQSHPRFMCATF